MTDLTIMPENYDNIRTGIVELPDEKLITEELERSRRKLEQRRPSAG
jgi:hypothetical protein